MSHRNIIALACAFAFAAVVTGCGKGSESGGKAPEVASGKEPTEFQKSKLIGHYSTLDGTSGFILDRTQDPWVARLDGTETNEPLVWQGAHHDATDYVSPSKKVWIRVRKESGDVLLFQGPGQKEGVSVTRDANAKSLH